MGSSCGDIGVDWRHYDHSGTLVFILKGSPKGLSELTWANHHHLGHYLKSLEPKGRWEEHPTTPSQSHEMTLLLAGVAWRMLEYNLIFIYFELTPKEIKTSSCFFLNDAETPFSFGLF